MNLDRNLVMVKGQDRTKDIRTWTYKNKRIVITYNDGAVFPYAYYNVEFFKDPVEPDIKDYCIIKNKNPLTNVCRIQDFGKHIRIFYNSGYSETLNSREVELVKSCLVDEKSNNLFEYLKQTANAVSLRTDDGSSILGNHYNNLKFIREDSILASYLSGKFPSSSGKNFRIPIYPFGFNESQKKAVEKALSNRLSVIEGPPGTGKTQTILNIISNVVMKGESVAVTN
jgi:hypothetical protein